MERQQPHQLELAKREEALGLGQRMGPQQPLGPGQAKREEDQMLAQRVELQQPHQLGSARPEEARALRPACKGSLMGRSSPLHFASQALCTKAA